MSQKPRSFQSKRTGGGQKFSRGDKPAGAGRGRGFTKRSEGDSERRRDDRGFGDRPARPPRRDGEGFKGGARGGKSFGDRDSRPARSFDGERPRKSFGDRPARSFDGDKKPFGRKDGPRKPFDRDKKSFGDRPARSFDGEKKPFGRKDGPRKPFDRDKKSFGDRPARSFDSDRPRGKSFGDRPPRDKKSFGDRPARSFGGDKKPFGKKPYDRDRGFEKKRFDKPFEERQSFDAAPRDDVRQKLKSDRPSYGAPSAAYLYGVHAVTQALLNPDRRNKRLLCTEKGFESLREAWDDAEAEGITLPVKSIVEKEDIDRLLPRDAVHQDVLLDTLPLEEVFLADITLHAPDDAVILVLDQVTDPHNVGAIMRSAAAFGALAVVVQTLHAPDITGVLAKTASGAVEHVPLVREVNLSRSLEHLKKAGFFCIGLAEEGKSTLAGMNLGKSKTALVLGAEGDGLRRLVAENCDTLAKLPTQGPIGSLNVSNAAAVALYELARAKK